MLTTRGLRMQVQQQRRGACSTGAAAAAPSPIARGRRRRTAERAAATPGGGSAGGAAGLPAGPAYSAAPPAPSSVAPSPSSAPAARGSVIPRRRPRLLPADFQHPLDQQNTALLRALPGLEAAARAILTSPAVEESLVIQNLASSVKAGPKQLSTLHGLMADAARALDLDGPAPDLYVRQSPTPNAYTLAVGGGRRPFVVVHTSLLDLLSRDELRAVLAHEVAHLKCEHGTWLTAANALASGASGLLPLVGPALESALLRWLRAAELTCDRGALLATGDPRVVVGALMRLAGGSSAYGGELCPDAFLEQAREFQDATRSGFGKAIGGAQQGALTHPHPVVRAREVDRWAASPQYARLRAAAAAAGGGAGGGGGGGGLAGGGPAVVATR